MWFVLIALVIGALVFVTSGCCKKTTTEGKTLIDGTTATTTTTTQGSKYVNTRKKSGGRLETVHNQRWYKVFRVKVPDGWIVIYDGAEGAGLVVYSDPEHQWILD
ncbi:MAG: hypothetical protein V3U54_07720 [Thermodesulfobacteriota bacterium]